MLQVKYTPWESIEKGNAAFLEYLQEALQRRLPKIADYVEFNIARES
jgi:hypothetical protein